MLPYNHHQPPQHMNPSYVPVPNGWSMPSNGHYISSHPNTPQYTPQYAPQQGLVPSPYPSQYPSHPEYPTHNVPQYQSVHPPPPQLDQYYNRSSQGWSPSSNHVQYGPTMTRPVHYEKMERAEGREQSRSVRSGISTTHQEKKKGWGGGGGGPRERTRPSGNSIGSSSSDETLTPHSSLTQAEKREFAGLIQDLWRDARFAQEFKQYSVTEFSKIRLLLEKIETSKGIRK